MTPPPEAVEGEGTAAVRGLNSRRRSTLEDVFRTPTRADIPWRDIEALFRALGGEVSQGRGSRVRVALLGQRATFHEPHPEKVADRGAVEDVREFLTRAGATP